MTPQERQMLQELKQKVDKIDNYTTNLGGSLEFRTLVQRYILGVGGVFQVDGTFKHTGTQAGLFGKTPVTQQAKINDPSGGLTVDSEARSAINSIIDALEAIGITSST